MLAFSILAKLGTTYVNGLRCTFLLDLFIGIPSLQRPSYFPNARSAPFLALVLLEEVGEAAAGVVSAVAADFDIHGRARASRAVGRRRGESFLSAREGRLEQYVGSKVRVWAAG